MTGKSQYAGVAAWPWPAELDALSSVWSDALPPHSLENVGATEILIISVELKQVAA